MKSLVLVVLAGVLVLSQGDAQAEEAKNGEDLQRLVAIALADNPEIKSSSARWQMFRNRIEQAKSLDDPMLMLKIQNAVVRDPFNFSRDPMTQKVLGISQQLPFWGKRDLKAEVAAKEAESYQWQIEERKLELARMVKENWYQLWLVDKEIDIVDKNIRIIDDFIALAETRYSVGQGVQQDVLKAQVERSKMLDMRISLEQRRKSFQAALNSLLYRKADTAIAKIPDFVPRKLSVSSDQLRDQAKENRPLLKSLKAAIDKGAAGHKLAQKEYYPDFNVSFEYMQRDRVNEMEAGDNMYSLGVTFNLPVQRERRQAMLAESTSEIRMATEELNSQYNAIDQSIVDLLAQVERREKLVVLYRTGIIPQAEQALESAVISYRVGKVDFLALLDSRLTLFNYEREYYDSLADSQMKLAQLEALVGRELGQ